MRNHLYAIPVELVFLENPDFSVTAEFIRLGNLNVILVAIVNSPLILGIN